MRIICITVNDDNYVRMGGLYGDHPAPPSSLSRTRQHFLERGVDADFFYGIHAVKLGVDTSLPYEVDGGPGCGYKMGPKPTGCWLSHRALFAACLLLSDDLFFIIEDDAIFPEDWKIRVDQAIEDAGDFDALYCGSCCTQGKPKSHIKGAVYSVQWPLCTHGIIWHRRALDILIKTSDDAKCYAPIDLSLMFHSLPKLARVYTVLPRILSQYETNIPE